MHNSWHDHAATLAAMTTAGALLVGQLIVADVAAIRAGHRAGTPIPPDFSRFYFRAARAHANTNESIATFALLAVTGILVGAPSAWLAAAAWLYVLARALHMTAYYLHRKPTRSIAFGISLAALLLMLGIVGQALLR